MPPISRHAGKLFFLLSATLALTCADFPALQAHAQSALQPGLPGPALAPPRPDRPRALPSANAPALVITPSPQITNSDQAATVLADNLSLTGPRSLSASGQVIVWYQGKRLVARNVSYDGNNDRIVIEGPVHLSTPSESGTENEVVLIADSAQLDASLRDGILRGARLVLAREMQMAARSAALSDDGYRVTLSQVVASSCQICADNPVPLWEVRAKEIVHDRRARKIHFDRPQFHAFGVPLLTIPKLTTPDPTVERMNGFLTPSFRTTSGLGPGVKLPYFITLGESADLTLTPYLAASRTSTLEARYRQALRYGDISLEGSVSRDDIKSDKTRGYLFGEAKLRFQGNWQFDGQLQMTSDRAYLLEYDITESDRLWSGGQLLRVERDSLAYARAGEYQTLREDEAKDTIPAQVVDLFWQKRFSPSGIGGETVLEWSAHGHRRPSGNDISGRDVARTSLSADWQRDHLLPAGILARTQARLEADLYRIGQDSRYDKLNARVVPSAAVTLRWPLIRGGSDGASQLLEPVIQLAWSPKLTGSDDLPDEDSTLWEFDEGNLFSLSRYPGRDSREAGLRANIGLGWTRFDPDGWSLALAAGRVLRREEQTNPDGTHALPSFAKLRSDWLLSANFSNDAGYALASRAVLTDAADIMRAELRAGIIRPKMHLSAGYIWIDGDSEPGRGQDISELVLESGWQVAPGWWATGETRYDFSDDRAQKAALGVTYRNECVSVDMGIERRFNTANDLRAETRFDLSVRLGGFGQPSKGAQVPGTVASRSCVR